MHTKSKHLLLLCFGLLVLIGGLSGTQMSQHASLSQNSQLSLESDPNQEINLPSTLASAGIIGSLDTNQAYELVMLGDIAIVADALEGLKFIKISAPTSPQLIGSYDTNQAHSLALDGKILYVGDMSGGFRCFSVANPSNPVLLSTYSTGGNAYGVDYYGKYVYQSNWDNSLVYILDLNNTSSPQLRGTMSVQAKQVLVSGSRLFLAKSSSVAMYDITVPTDPVLLDEYIFGDGGSNSERLWIEGNILYVTRHGAGFAYLDITNPYDMQYIAHTDTPGDCVAIKTNGELLFVGDGAAGLRVYNIADPIAPVLIQTYNASSYMGGFDFWGNHIIIGDDTYGIKVIKIGEYISPVKLGSYVTAAQTIAAYVDGNVAYMAAYGAGLVCLNVSNLASPTYLGAYNTPWNADDVVVSNNIAYVADSDSGIQIINVTNPTTPTFIGSYNTPGNAAMLVKKGCLLFIGDAASGLYIINVSNPASPTFVGQCSVGQATYGVAVQGNLAFLSGLGTGGLYIIDVSNPYNPSLLKTVSFPGAAHDVKISGDYAFVPTLNEGLNVINFKNLSNPYLETTYAPGNGTRLFIKGDIAYVADSNAMKLELINITVPYNPVMIGQYTSSDGCQNVFVSGNIAYLADHYLGLTTLKIAELEWNFNDSPTIYSPVDRTWNVGTTGQVISWYIEDTTTQVPRMYSVWENGLCVATGTWATNTNISYTVPSLTVGTYHYQVQVNDGLGKNSSDDVIVNVLNIAPTVSSPADQSWDVNTTGHNISWVPTDDSTNASSRNYQIMRNYTGVSSGFWTSGSAITYVIDGLDLGSYVFLILFDDGFGGNVTDVVNVNVGGNALPTLSSPMDQSWYYDSTGHTLSWMPTDSTTQGLCGYTVWHNGSKTHTGNWTTGVAISFNLDGLAVGDYIFELQINDGYVGGNASDSVVVTVLNDLPLLGSPDDQIWVANTTGHFVNWTIVDSSTQMPRIYSIWHEATCVAVGNWISYNGISVGIDSLSIGYHTLEIQVNDGFIGGNASDSVNINVTSNNLPSLTSPLDQSWDYDSTGHTLSWTATDMTTQGPCMYTIWQNGSKTHNGTWISGVAISFNLDGLAVGSYIFEIQVNDGIPGGNASDSVGVTVLNVLPSLNSPVDQNWYFGTTGHYVNWTIEDNSTQMPRTYSIWHESMCVSVGTWIPYNGISLVVDGLAIGNHTVEIQVNDGFSGGNSSDIVEIIVLSNSLPVVSTPSDQSGDYGSDITLSWTVTDSTTEVPCTYAIWRNGTVIQTGTWVSGNTISYLISFLAINSYVFELQVNDGIIGGNASDQVNVVITNGLPSFSTHDTQSWEIGSTGHTLSWNPFDMSTQAPRFYSIWLNSTCLVVGTWTSGFSTQYNFDALPIGTHSVTIQFNDGFVGGNASETFSITVTGNVVPSLSTPGDQSWECGTTGHIVSWLPTDSSIGITEFYVYRNGTMVNNGSWTSGSDLNVPIDGLDVGNYNFTCVVYDGLGGSAQDSLNVTVLNGLPLLSAPDNMVYAVGTTGHFISWTPTDSSTIGTPLYSIWNESLCVASGSWISGSSISISVDGYVPGIYMIQIQVNDGYVGGNASDTVTLTISANSAPILTNPANQSWAIGTTGHVILWTVNDADIATTSYQLYRNGALIDSGSWINGELLSTNLDSLAPGIYNYTLIVNDGLPVGISSDEVTIIVWNTRPYLTTCGDMSFAINTTSHQLSWYAEDPDLGSNVWYNITDNGLLVIQNALWISGANITFSLDSLLPGNHSIVILVSDGYAFNSTATDTVDVYISNNAPILTQPADLSYSYLTSGHSLQWNVTDVNTMNPRYWIYCDQLLSANGSWVNGQTLTYNLDGLSVGFHNVTIYVNDGYNATASDLVWVEIYNYTPAAPVITSILPNPSPDGNVVINWTSVPFAANYTVYHYTSEINALNASVMMLGTTDTIFFAVSNLAEGPHYFVVIASNASGNSGMSNCLSVMVDYPVLPPQISILQPTNGSIFTTLDNLVLSYYVANIPQIQNVWYMVNSSGQWITIGGNTTFSVSASGTHSIVVRVRSSLGENYTSTPAVFQVLIQTGSNASIQIDMQVISGTFDAGQTLEIQVTITNKGPMDIANFFIFFNLSTSEYVFDSASINSYTFVGFTVDQSKVFVLKIRPTDTYSNLTILGYFVADNHREEIAYPLQPQDAATQTDPLIYVFSIAGAAALGGSAYYGMKKKKGNNGSKSFGFNKPDKHADKNEPRLEHNEDGEFTW